MTRNENEKRTRKISFRRPNSSLRSFLSTGVLIDLSAAITGTESGFSSRVSESESNERGFETAANALIWFHSNAVDGKRKRFCAKLHGKLDVDSAMLADL